MPDYFEFMYSFDARNPGDALEDADGDGLSNLEEYRLGTNPLNPGNVGIGVSDPTEKLHVDGNVLANNVVDLLAYKLN